VTSAYKHRDQGTRIENIGDCELRLKDGTQKNDGSGVAIINKPGKPSPQKIPEAERGTKRV